MNDFNDPHGETQDVEYVSFVIFHVALVIYCYLHSFEIICDKKK